MENYVLVLIYYFNVKIIILNFLISFNINIL